MQYQFFKYVHQQLLLILSDRQSCLTQADIEHLFEANYKSLKPGLDVPSLKEQDGNMPDTNKLNISGLLWLTNLRLLFQTSKHDERYQLLLSNVDLHSVSKSLLSVEPHVKYERYLLVRVVVALFGVPTFQSHVCFTVENIIRQLLLARQVERNSLLEIMTALLSCHNLSYDVCMETLMPHWSVICSHCQKCFLLEQLDCKSSYHSLYIYLSLWQKMIKRMHTKKSDQINKSIKLYFFDHEHFFQFLQSIQIDNFVLCRIFFNLLNLFFGYEQLSCAKIKDTVYLTISKEMLKLEKKFLCFELKSDHIGFGGFQNILSELYDSGLYTECEMDLAWLRSLSLLYAKTTAILLQCTNELFIEAFDSLFLLNEAISSKLEHTCVDTFDWLSKLFGEQDDGWIEMLLILLDIYLQFSGKSRMEHCSRNLCPHRMFLQFLIITGNDYNFLVDLLTSPETCFLLYFTKYLKCVLHEWAKFVHFLTDSTDCSESNSCMLDSDSGINQSSRFAETLIKTDFSSGEQMMDVTSTLSEGLSMIQVYSDSEDNDDTNENCDSVVLRPNTKHSELRDTDTNCRIKNSQKLDDTMAVIIRVRLKIEKLNASGMFPYNPRPLLALIEQCEYLHENG